MLEVIGSPSGEISCERLYLNCALASECPECGKCIKHHCGPPHHLYLSYPVMNEESSICFECQDCDAFWYEKLIFKVEIVPTGRD